MNYRDRRHMNTDTIIEAALLGTWAPFLQEILEAGLLSPDDPEAHQHLAEEGLETDQVVEVFNEMGWTMSRGKFRGNSRFTLCVTLLILFPFTTDRDLSHTSVGLSDSMTALDASIASSRPTAQASRPPPSAEAATPLEPVLTARPRSEKGKGKGKAVAPRPTVDEGARAARKRRDDQSRRERAQAPAPTDEVHLGDSRVSA